ncbi:MAG: 4-alpha-glucanotransferase, partial [Clostridia bacterium]|nr:4-alpha-glucanotransferase [Clostridia bacterium]
MRSSGILLHITSLPSATGVGTLAEVDRFIDFLVASKQTYWQILPITPTDFVNSPYASPSAFAGNTLVIDVDALAEQGLVSEQTLADSKLARGNDFVYAKQRKEIMLREAYGNFIKQDPPKDYQQFCDDNEYWLDDYTLFCALKKHFGGKSWLYWEDQDIRNRVPEALKHYKELLSDEMDFVAFTQYVFFSQWKTFRNKLQQKGIQLVGDIPIYVNYDSADVWAHSQLFKLTKDKKPKCVAGVPPDYFSADGQLWGNPLYRWDVMKKDKYQWWTKRVQKCSQLFDVLRI